MIHGRLGPGVTRAVPCCVVIEIRKQFPEETETYMGFIPGGEGDDDIPESESDTYIDELKYF